MGTKLNPDADRPTRDPFARIQVLGDCIAGHLIGAESRPRAEMKKGEWYLTLKEGDEKILQSKWQAMPDKPRVKYEMVLTLLATGATEMVKGAKDDDGDGITLPIEAGDVFRFSFHGLAFRYWIDLCRSAAIKGEEDGDYFSYTATHAVVYEGDNGVTKEVRSQQKIDDALRAKKTVGLYADEDNFILRRPTVKEAKWADRATEIFNERMAAKSAASRTKLNPATDDAYGDEEPF